MHSSAATVPIRIAVSAMIRLHPGSPSFAKRTRSSTVRSPWVTLNNDVIRSSFIKVLRHPRFPHAQMLPSGST